MAKTDPEHDETGDLSEEKASSEPRRPRFWAFFDDSDRWLEIVERWGGGIVGAILVFGGVWIAWAAFNGQP